MQTRSKTLLDNQMTSTGFALVHLQLHPVHLGQKHREIATVFAMTFQLLNPRVSILKDKVGSMAGSDLNRFLETHGFTKTHSQTAKDTSPALKGYATKLNAKLSELLAKLSANTIILADDDFTRYDVHLCRC